eukprot:8941027-Lingulodinium_polyedra.AAC.1
MQSTAGRSAQGRCPSSGGAAANTARWATPAAGAAAAATAARRGRPGWTSSRDKKSSAAQLPLQ